MSKNEPTYVLSDERDWLRLMRDRAEEELTPEIKAEIAEGERALWAAIQQERRRQEYVEGHLPSDDDVVDLNHWIAVLISHVGNLAKPARQKSAHLMVRTCVILAAVAVAIALWVCRRFKVTVTQALEEPPDLFGPNVRELLRDPQ